MNNEATDREPYLYCTIINPAGDKELQVWFHPDGSVTTEVKEKDDPT